MKTKDRGVKGIQYMYINFFITPEQSYLATTRDPGERYPVLVRVTPLECLRVPFALFILILILIHGTGYGYPGTLSG